MTTYKKASPSSVFYEEIARPQCQYFSSNIQFYECYHYRLFSWVDLCDAKGARVSRRYVWGFNDSKFRVQVLLDFLKDSKFTSDIPYIAERFDKTTKLTFVNPDEGQVIRFGGLRDKAPELNIKSGQLKLLGWVCSATSHSPSGDDCHCRAVPLWSNSLNHL